MSFPRRFAGVFFRPSRTFQSLADRPVWVDALIVVLIAGAALNYLVFPLVQQDKLRSFKDTAAGFIERHGEERYAAAVARIEHENRAFDAFVVRPMIALTVFLFSSLIALGAGRAMTRRGHYLQIFSCLIHASLVAVIPGNAVRLALVLALVVALGYFLMGAGIIQAGDPGLNDGSYGDTAPWGFDWIAGGVYVIAGLALILKKRWIPITLAVINIIPIAVFYFMWADRPDVLWSAPGLITKIAQVLLESGLVYHLIRSKLGTSAKTA